MKDKELPYLTVVVVEDWVSHEVRRAFEIVREAHLCAVRSTFQRGPRHAKALQLNVHWVVNIFITSPETNGKKWRKNEQNLEMEVRKDIKSPETGAGFFMERSKALYLKL